MRQDENMVREKKKKIIILNLFQNMKGAIFNMEMKGFRGV